MCCARAGREARWARRAVGRGGGGRLGAQPASAGVGCRDCGGLSRVSRLRRVLTPRLPRMVAEMPRRPLSTLETETAAAWDERGCGPWGDERRTADGRRGSRWGRILRRRGTSGMWGDGDCRRGASGDVARGARERERGERAGNGARALFETRAWRGAGRARSGPER
eukprot:4256790-Prymnesium_polylepis.1